MNLDLWLTKTRAEKSRDYREIIVFQKAPFSKRFPSNTRKRKIGDFIFLQVEEPFRKVPFSWRISVDGRPIRRNKAAFSNSSRGVACAAGRRRGGKSKWARQESSSVPPALCALVFSPFSSHSDACHADYQRGNECVCTFFSGSQILAVGWKIRHFSAVDEKLSLLSFLILCRCHRFVWRMSKMQLVIFLQYWIGWSGNTSLRLTRCHHGMTQLTSWSKSLKGLVNYSR